MSDTAAVQDQLKWGLATDCPTNPLCGAPGGALEQYGLTQQTLAGATLLAPCDTPMADALKNGTIDVAELCSTQPDILVNGCTDLWVDRGRGLQRMECPLPDEAAVRALAVRLAARSGRRLDDANPCVDARLPTGERLHAVIPPIAATGTAISLRVPARRRYTLAELATSGTFGDREQEWLAALVRSRAAFLVTGGTGSGKTTVLTSLLGLVDPGERIVIAEDTMELRPDHPHVVNLESRPANVEGSGAVNLQALVRQALRMRPDRLVVGEVRGAEIVDLLGALNTGHEGGCGTLHANGAADVPARVEALALAAGLPAEGARAQLLAGIEVVIHVCRDAAGRRRLAEVAALRAGPGGSVVATPALSLQAGVMRPGPAHDALAARLAVSHS
jgi:pilus assembly protein CpaF